MIKIQLNKENKQEAETFCFVLHYEIAISQLGAAISTQTVLLQDYFITALYCHYCFCHYSHLL